MDQQTASERAKRPATQSQPLEAANNPDALLTIKTVAALMGITPSTVWRWLAAGKFPPPIRQGTRCTRWRAGDVTTWLRKLATE